MTFTIYIPAKRDCARNRDGSTAEFASVPSAWSWALKNRLMTGSYAIIGVPDDASVDEERKASLKAYENLYGSAGGA